jgi:predicted ATPase
MARCVLGHPDEALAKANEGLAFVRNATQPFLLARGLAAVGFVYVFRREPRGSDSELPAVLALCVEQGFAYFHAVVSAFQGANLVLLGDKHEGIELMQASLAALRAAGSELLSTLILVNLANAHLALEHFDDAQTVLDEGLSTVERTGERWAESELHRLRGQLLQLRGAQDQAETFLRNAFDIAHDQQTKSFELRASTALAAHWQHLDRKGEAKALLSEVLAGWPADLDGADLRDARALFAQLC